MDEKRHTGRELPEWVPERVSRYLAHTELSCSIRSIARDAGQHPSTVMRQIRRVELQREDPLADAALVSLAEWLKPQLPNKSPAGVPDDMTLKVAARRLLPRLCETGSVLIVADTFGTAAIVRGNGSEGTLIAGLELPVARALALLGWIACASSGRIIRYRITGAGRAAVSRLLAEAENRACDPDEGEAGSQVVTSLPAAGAKDRPPRRARYGVPESPLAALARRRDRDGAPFLEAGLVQAGERLREDFELGQTGYRDTDDQGRDIFTGNYPPPPGPVAASGPGAARDRVARALADLGPGLGDVALRCCCYLEGLEAAEKRMGWSARSGKIVLRIALQRLRLHYEQQNIEDRMIG